MILDTVVTVYSATPSKNARGQVSNSFASVGTIPANLQPISMTGHAAQSWGISDIPSESRIMFFGPGSLSMVKELRRVANAAGIVYEVRKVNPWPSHGEALLVPVQGG